MPIGNITSAYLGLEVDASASTGLTSEDQRFGPSGSASYVDNFQSLTAVGGLGAGAYFSYQYLRKKDRFADLTSVGKARISGMNETVGHSMAKGGFVGYEHMNLDHKANYTSSVKNKLFKAGESGGIEETGSTIIRATTIGSDGGAFSHTRNNSDIMKVFEDLRLFGGVDKGYAISGRHGEDGGLALKAESKHGIKTFHFPVVPKAIKQNPVSDAMAQTPLYKEVFGNNRIHQELTGNVYGSHAGYLPKIVDPTRSGPNSIVEFYDFFQSSTDRLKNVKDIKAFHAKVFGKSSSSDPFLSIARAKRELGGRLVEEMNSIVEYGGLDPSKRGANKAFEVYNPATVRSQGSVINALISEKLGVDSFGLKLNPLQDSPLEVLAERHQAIVDTNERLGGQMRVGGAIVTPGKITKGYHGLPGLSMNSIMPFGELKDVKRPTHEARTPDRLVSTISDVKHGRLMSRITGGKDAMSTVWAGRAMSTSIDIEQEATFGEVPVRGESYRMTRGRVGGAFSRHTPDGERSITAIHGIVSHVTPRTQEEFELMRSHGILSSTGGQEGVSLIDQSVAPYLTKQVQRSQTLYGAPGAMNDAFVDSLKEELRRKYKTKLGATFDGLEGHELIEKIRTGEISRQVGEGSVSDLFAGVNINVTGNAFKEGIAARSARIDLTGATVVKDGISVHGYETLHSVQGISAMLGEAHVSPKYASSNEIAKIGKSIKGVNPMAVMSGGFRSFDYVTGKLNLAMNLPEITSSAGLNLPKPAIQAYNKKVRAVLSEYYDFIDGSDLTQTEGLIVTGVKDKLKNNNGDIEPFKNSLFQIRKAQQELFSFAPADQREVAKDLLYSLGGVTKKRRGKGSGDLKVIAPKPGVNELFVMDLTARTNTVQDYKGGKLFSYGSSGGKIRLERVVNLGRIWERSMGKDNLSPIAGRMMSIIRSGAVNKIDGIEINPFDEFNRMIRLNAQDNVDFRAKSLKESDIMHLKKGSPELDLIREQVRQLRTSGIEQVDLIKSENLPPELRQFVEKGVYLDSDLFEGRSAEILDRQIGNHRTTIGSRGGIYFSKFGSDGIAISADKAFTSELSRKRLDVLGEMLDYSGGTGGQVGATDKMVNELSNFMSYEQVSFTSKEGILNRSMSKRAYGLAHYARLAEGEARLSVFKNARLSSGSLSYDITTPLEQMVTEGFMKAKHGISYNQIVDAGALTSGAYEAIEMDAAELAHKIVSEREVEFTDDAVRRYFDRHIATNGVYEGRYREVVNHNLADDALGVISSTNHRVERITSADLKENSLRAVRKMMKREAKSKIQELLTGGNGTSNQVVQVGMRTLGMSSFEPLITGGSDYVVGMNIIKDDVANLLGYGSKVNENILGGEIGEIFKTRYGGDASHVVHTTALSRLQQFRDLDADEKPYHDLNFSDDGKTFTPMSDKKARDLRTNLAMLKSKQEKKLGKVSKMLMAEQSAANYWRTSGKNKSIIADDILSKGLALDDLANFDLLASKTAQKAMTGPNTIAVNTARQVFLGMNSEILDQVSRKYGHGKNEYFHSAIDAVFAAQSQGPIQKGAGAYGLMAANQIAMGDDVAKIKSTPGTWEQHQLTKSNKISHQLMRLTASAQGEQPHHLKLRESAARELAELMASEDKFKSTMARMNPLYSQMTHAEIVQEQAEFYAKTFGKISKTGMILDGAENIDQLENTAKMLNESMYHVRRAYGDIYNQTGVDPKQIAGMYTAMGRSTDAYSFLSDMDAMNNIGENDLGGFNHLRAMIDPTDPNSLSADVNTKFEMERRLIQSNEDGNITKVMKKGGHDSLADKGQKSISSFLDNMIAAGKGIYNLGSGSTKQEHFISTSKALGEMAESLKWFNESGAGRATKYGAGIFGGLWVASHTMNAFNESPAYGDPGAPSTGSAPLPQSTMLDDPMMENQSEGYTVHSQSPARISFENGQNLGGDINIVQNGDDVDGAFGAIPSGVNFDNVIIQDSRRTFDRSDANRFASSIRDGRF